VIIPEHDAGAGQATGVLVAHGDLTSGYSLFIEDGHLVHDLNIGGSHQLLRSDRPVPGGRHQLGFRMQRSGSGLIKHGVGTLLIDGEPAGSFETENIFWILISWSGLDIGLDRGTPVSHYASPNEFTGTLERVVIELDDDQDLDANAVLEQEVTND
jgi:arylsulfatase